MLDNEKIFTSIWNKNRNYPFLAISSNSGTGKTTRYKWQFLRDAKENGVKLDIIYRWQDDLESKFTSGAFLTPPANASKRLLKLANSLEILKDGSSYFVAVKDTKEKIAQAVAINTQSKLKSTENPLYTSRALFDEILADDGHYAPDECYKFCRLIDTKARQRKYQVVALYNNTTPFLPYRDYFEEGAIKYINFTAKSFADNKDDASSIQSCLKKSQYNEVYKNNNYKFYTEFYKEVDTTGADTLFYLRIEDRLFAVKDFDDYYMLVTKKKVKKNREVYSFNLANNDYILASSSNGVIQVLQTMLNNRLLFTNEKNNTIYLKELANNINICYTI